MSCGNTGRCASSPTLGEQKDRNVAPNAAVLFPQDAAGARPLGCAPAPQRTAAAERFSAPDAGDYPFEGLPNTRDLGGIRTQDGRHIRPGTLFRSGALDRGTRADLDALVNRFEIRTVIDLRRACAPESRDAVLLSGAPVRCVNAGMDGLRPLIPSPLRNTRWAFAIELKKLNLFPRAYQKHMYEAMLFERDNQAALTTAFEIFLSPPDGAVLWHCTIGKDRTGLLAALLLHCLGVDRATIMQDYLASTFYLTTFGNEDDRVLRAHGLPEVMRNNVHETHTARAEYLDAAWNALERTYGSVDGFLSEVLGVGEDERRQMQDLYLE